MAQRKYKQKRRAEKAAETHDRIVEATMELHEEIGAARTSISAVAEKAGVQRLTVYRHFPDEDSLLHACTSRWLELHPMPEITELLAGGAAVKQLRAAVRGFYRYYGETAAMWESSERDRSLVPALAERMAEVDAHLDEVAAQLTRAFKLRGRRRDHARTTIRHGLAFGSWRSLAAMGLSADEAARLVSRWVAGLVD